MKGTRELSNKAEKIKARTHDEFVREVAEDCIIDIYYYDEEDSPPICRTGKLFRFYGNRLNIVKIPSGGYAKN
jgi:hypothetical protein